MNPRDKYMLTWLLPTWFTSVALGFILTKIFGNVFLALCAWSFLTLIVGISMVEYLVKNTSIEYYLPLQFGGVAIS